MEFLALASLAKLSDIKSFCVHFRVEVALIVLKSHKMTEPLSRVGGYESPWKDFASPQNI